MNHLYGEIEEIIIRVIDDYDSLTIINIISVDKIECGYYIEAGSRNYVVKILFLGSITAFNNNKITLYTLYVSHHSSSRGSVLYNIYSENGDPYSIYNFIRYPENELGLDLVNLSKKIRNEASTTSPKGNPSSSSI